MRACNVVKFKVKPGLENAFLDAHRTLAVAWAGLESMTMIKTGEASYCLIGQWESMAALAAARPAMIATLDTFRHTLLDLGDGKGVTDAVSGEVVLST